MWIKTICQEEGNYIFNATELFCVKHFKDRSIKFYSDANCFQQVVYENKQKRNEEFKRIIDILKSNVTP